MGKRRKHDGTRQPADKTEAKVFQLHRSRSAEDWFRQAYYAESDGRDQEALICYRYAVEADPDHLPAWFDLALLLKSLGRFDESKACLKEILALNRFHYRAILTLGNIAFAQGNLQQAREHYEETRRVKPDYAKALHNLSIVYDLLNLHDLAYEARRAYVRLTDDPCEATGAGELLRPCSQKAS